MGRVEARVLTTRSLAGSCITNKGSELLSRLTVPFFCLLTNL